MTILYFGDYDPLYARNRILVRGLEENGSKVILCNTRKRGFAGWFELIRKYRTLPPYDRIVVGYSDSRSMVPLARLLSRKPLVWDAFYSIYDSWVDDRALVSRQSLKAHWYWFLDFVSVKLAAHILLDTDAHRAYFAAMFRAPQERFIKVLVGADDAVFAPVATHPTPDIVRVGFHGKYIPLQGVDTIVRAAAMLADRKDIQFILVGTGQTYAAVRALANELAVANLVFTDRLAYEAIPGFIASLDIALGIFGVSGKAARVIPNKVYEEAAMGSAIITADTPAIRELFTDGADATLVPPGNPEALASAIARLADDAPFRARLGAAALSLFRAAGTPKKIAADLLAALSEREKKL